MLISDLPYLPHLAPGVFHFSGSMPLFFNPPPYSNTYLPRQARTLTHMDLSPLVDQPYDVVFLGTPRMHNGQCDTMDNPHLDLSPQMNKRIGQMSARLDSRYIQSTRPNQGRVPSLGEGWVHQDI